MTAEDLRAIITPAVEADLKAAGLWPTREGLNLSFHKNLKKHLLWGDSVHVVAFCHPDDARAQIERRLVEWCISRHWTAIKRQDTYAVTDQDQVGPVRNFVRSKGCPTLLHALLAAFAGRTAPTGEKEGA